LDAGPFDATEVAVKIGGLMRAVFEVKHLESFS